MFRKKNKVLTTEEIAKTQREELNASVRQARDVLVARVRSALAYNKALTVLPETSTEYKNAQYELVQVKQDVLDWMKVYTMAVHDLNDFCVKNNLRQAEWVSAMQIILFATENRA